MSAEENKKLDLKWVEAINQGNWAAIEKLAAEIYRPDNVYHNPSFPKIPQDFEHNMQWMQQVLHTHPDFHVAVEDVIAENDEVVTRGLMTGKNISTGEQLHMQFIHISRYSQGKIVEEWEMDVPVPIPVSA